MKKNHSGGMFGAGYSRQMGRYNRMTFGQLVFVLTRGVTKVRVSGEA